MNRWPNVLRLKASCFPSERRKRNDATEKLPDVHCETGREADQVQPHVLRSDEAEQEASEEMESVQHAAEEDTMKFHPGEFIRDELEARGWSIETLAEESGLNRARLEPLIAEKRSLTLIDAHGLAIAFGTGRDVWVNLQKSFDQQSEK